MRGTDFAEQLQALSPAQREVRVLAHLDKQVRWPWVPVPILGEDGAPRGEVRVASDLFAIGEPGDFLRIPLSGPGADMVAATAGAILPTSKLSDLIWQAADVKLPPLPWGPPYDGSMLSLDRVIEHHRRIEDERAGRTGLVAGHKKDVVLSKRLGWQPKQVAIYGWHRANDAGAGVPIQPLSLFHEASYADYSHGVRLVHRTMTLDGHEVDIEDVLANPATYALLARGTDGPLTTVRYPGSARPASAPSKPPPSTPAAPPPLLRLGMVGHEDEVRAWQARLQGLRYSVLVTGEFDAATDKATRAFQGAHGLAQDGIVGPLTRKAAEGAVPPPKAHGGPIPFVQAQRFTPATGRPIDLVVLHSTEGSEVAGAARAVATWFAGKAGVPAPQASAHYVVDASSIVQCVREEDVAWHAPGANHNGIGVEHVGYAKQKPTDWGDPYSAAELALSAALVATVCKRHGIPVAFVDAAGLLRHERGITTHAEVTKAFHGSGHTDPGAGFPMDAYLAMVRAS